MARDKGYKVHRGYNFRILDFKGFDPICFGCPPGIVKDFSERSDELPSKYVLPLRTFVKGKNNFDFEFIVYSFLFVKTTKEKITIYCTQGQKERFMAILIETLFGPTFENLIQAQFRSLGNRCGFSTKELEKFRKFLSKVARDKKLSKHFNQQLKSLAKDKEVRSEMVLCFKELLSNTPWLAGKKIKNLAEDLANDYILCGQLKNEMDLFVLAKEEDRDHFINGIVNFQIFDKKNAVFIQSPDDKRQKLKIVQVRPADFEVFHQGKKKCSIDILNLDKPPLPNLIHPLEKPFMGVTYLGVGSGFTHKRKNSSLICWAEGKGIMVDAFSDNNESTLNYGITENDISYMFLSHVHSDHDSGFIEKILSGQRIKLITSRIIFESFLRKIQGITRFPLEVIESFVDFFEVEPKKRVKLPGFQNTYLEFDYSLHSIPTGRFRLIYKGRTGKEKVISHSGDTKYDVELVNLWRERGVFTESRKKEILGFLWDADLIIHEVGGGALHTEFSSLTHLDPSVTQKMVLVHQHKEPFKHPYFRFASEGETDVLIKSKKSKVQTQLELLQDAVLFSNVKRQELLSLLKGSKVLKMKPGEVVFSKNEIGDAFYLILDGFAEVILNSKSSTVYEKGMFFGELAIATKDPRRRATVKALSPITLLKIPKKFYFKSRLPEIMDDFYSLGNYFNNFIRPGLIASLGLGDLVHWNQGESIYKKGLNNNMVYVIISGEVRIDGPGKNGAAVLTNGDIFGQLPDWKNFKTIRRVSAQSGQVLAVRMPSEQLNQLFKLYPSFWGTSFQKMKRLDAALG